METPKIKDFVLASTSAFRKQILVDMGVTFKVQGAHVDELQIVGHSPESTARYRADAKAFDVAIKQHSASLVLGADQVLGFDGCVINKVQTRDEARQKLQMLAGRKHVLHSACVGYEVTSTGRIYRLFSRVWDVIMPMRAISELEIERYLDTEQWRDVVGCYRYENVGDKFFEFTSTLPDPTWIIGLPREAVELTFQLGGLPLT